MQASQPTVDYMAVLQRRLHWLIWPPLFIFLAVTAVALALPNLYQSYATILIEGQQVTSDLVPSTVTTYADQRIQSIKQEVMSRSNILNLVKRFDLYPKVREKISTDTLVSKVAQAITVKPLSAAVKTGHSDRPALVTIAFTLAFEEKSPHKAQAVVNDLTSFFSAKNLAARQASARGTTEFLEKQVEKANESLTELTEEIAEFKEAHLEELPEFMRMNLQKVEKIDNRIYNIEQQMLSLKEQAISIQYKLAFINPYSSAGRVLSDVEKLQQLNLQYAEFKAKYSEDHPKVRALKKEINILSNTVGQIHDLSQKRERLDQLEQNLIQSMSRYSDQHPVVIRIKAEIHELQKEIEATETNANGTAAETPKLNIQNVTNPGYINLQSELDRINFRLTSLQSEKRTLMEEEEEIYVKLRTMPDVEKEYQDLLMDRESAKRNVAGLQKKLQVATVAEGMEEGLLGERFTITEPAFLPDEPYGPNRIAIMVIGLVLGCGVGVGLAALREYSDHIIHMPEEVKTLTGVDVVSVIPYVQTDKERRKKRIKFVSIWSGTVIIMVGGITFFHYQIMDLYIFYDKLSKFLGDRFFVHF